MKNPLVRFYRRLCAGLLVLLVGMSMAHARAFSQPELDRMLAPIALYPDTLLSHVLMAATYPHEVAEAARWSRSYPGLRGDEAVRAADRFDWDPSVKSMTAFPEVLHLMAERLDWTEDLGEAFIEQEPLVMDTVQLLRQRAHAAGNLQSSSELSVHQDGRLIMVEPAQPQLVYVPYYDPLVVYGPWWHAAHPPVYWRPWAGYRPTSRVGLGLHWGPPARVSPGVFHGRVDWRQRHVVHHVHSRAEAPRRWVHEPERRRAAPQRERVEQRINASSGAGREEPRRHVMRDSREHERKDEAKQRESKHESKHESKQRETKHEWKNSRDRHESHDQRRESRGNDSRDEARRHVMAAPAREESRKGAERHEHRRAHREEKREERRK